MCGGGEGSACGSIQHRTCVCDDTVNIYVNICMIITHVLNIVLTSIIFLYSIHTLDLLVLIKIYL